jgi:anti-sigma-K factor RskA
MSDLPPEMADGEDLTAGEYALGVLDRAERAAAEARIAREPGFAREVEAWQARLYPMADAVAEVSPPAHVWPTIQRALGPTDPKVVHLAQRRAVAFWRNWAMAATAAAAVALVFLVVRPPAPPPVAPPAPAAPAILIASLNDKSGHGVMTAAYSPASGELHVTPNLALQIGRNRAAELWLIAADGVPRSLGVIDGAHPSAVRVPDALRRSAQPSAILAITLEQPGGSPNGKPTSKPLWVGHLASI